MSEYQYYEFAAIDRPLTQKEIEELRAVSTRADITPVSFVNHYEWGDLKADPSNWMQRYFDAFVYLANWCSCWLALRVPKSVFRKAEVMPYASKFTLTIDATKDHWLLYWSLDESENYDRFAMDDGSGWMRRLAPIRDELLRWDLRSLYLGWLADIHTLGKNKPEPEVPPGLSNLSPAQQALAEFLEIDPDLITAASTGSVEPSSTGITEDQTFDIWLKSWSNNDMKSVLKSIAEGQGHESERWVKSDYATWLKAQRPAASSNSPRRSVAKLLELTEAAAIKRREREAKAHQKRASERQRQREAHLREMMIDVKTHWDKADAQASRGVASGYDQAVKILANLAEGYLLTSGHSEFERDLKRFLAPYGKRRALLKRLSDAGLWSG